MSQFYWLGTDEAGYGARLGPLSISGTAWELKPELTRAWQPADADFLAQADQLDWQRNWGESDGYAIADSKKIYQPGKGLSGLQRVVSSLLAATGQQNIPATTFGELCRTIQSHSAKTEKSYWWTTASEVPFELPDAATMDADAQHWGGTAIRPLEIRNQLIDENAFNQGLVRWGNKASLLSCQTLRLVSDLLSELPRSANVIVDLDRHGGRKKYLPLLLESFDAGWMDILEETPHVSSYRWNEDGRRVFFRFSVNGERRFPVAVASMFSKLMRERAMECFNRFWQAERPGLKPTAGYPVDAERFKTEVAAERIKRGISNHVFWRNA